MEGLQGGRSTGTPVAAQLHTAFIQGARLDIEWEVLRVLDAAQVLVLLLSYLLDPVMVQQRDTQSVVNCPTETSTKKIGIPQVNRNKA